MLTAKILDRCYSAQEHSALKSSRTVSSTSAASLDASSPTSLPLDIAIEAVLATVVVCLGLVLGAPALRPIRWRAWAGAIEKEGPGAFSSPGEAEEPMGPVAGNPFRMLESRPGFVDIRRQRKEFAQWIKAGGNDAKVTA